MEGPTVSGNALLPNIAKLGSDSNSSPNAGDSDDDLNVTDSDEDLGALAMQMTHNDLVGASSGRGNKRTTVQDIMAY